jgi:hypothetical protein
MPEAGSLIENKVLGGRIYRKIANVRFALFEGIHGGEPGHAVGFIVFEDIEWGSHSGKPLAEIVAIRNSDYCAVSHTGTVRFMMTSSNQSRIVRLARAIVTVALRA